MYHAGAMQPHHHVHYLSWLISERKIMVLENPKPVSRFVLFIVLPLTAVGLALLGGCAASGQRVPSESRGAGIGNQKPSEVAETSIRLRDFRYDVQDQCEVDYEVPGNYAMTALGLRASGGQITTMQITIREILPDGTLGKSRQILKGRDPGHFPEGLAAFPMAT